MMKRILVMIVAVSFLATAGIALAQDYQVIVNKANSTSSVSKSNLKKIFTKKMKKWDNGTKVAPVDLVASAPARDAFSETVLGKSASDMKKYWQKKVFSGRGSPPPEKASDDAVVKYVKGNPGAVGYVSGAASVDGVKVIKLH